MTVYFYFFSTFEDVLRRLFELEKKAIEHEKEAVTDLDNNARYGLTVCYTVGIPSTAIIVLY